MAFTVARDICGRMQVMRYLEPAQFSRLMASGQIPMRAVARLG